MPQYFSRTNKALTTFGGPPNYGPNNLISVDVRASISVWSPNGKYLAYAAGGKTHVLDGDSGKPVCTVDVNAADITFSPQGTYLLTWTRGKKEESGNWIPNLKVWALDGSLKHELVQKGQGSWYVQWSADEKYVCWQPNSTTMFVGEDFKQTAKLQIPDGICQFSVSGGRNPYVAVFVFGQKGKPSNIRVYKLPSVTQQVAGRTLFKVDGVKLMWNAIGTSLLVWATTDHDSSGKTYYGEGSLFLLNVNSGSDSRINLDKDGPIHDVAWCPSSDEFGVTYGYMPSKTCFFDARGSPVNVLPLASRNTLSYSPHGRFVVVAGFGNIQGSTDVYDRYAKWNKICSIVASNTSYFEWSPDGRYLLTATTSPRLRVDNGVKLWHYTGKLVYHCKEEELFTVGWRPEEVPLTLGEPCAAPHESVADVKPGSTSASVPKSAYTPPHMRGKAATSTATTTSLHQRMLEQQGTAQPAELSKAAQKNKRRAANGSPAPAPAAAPSESAVTPEEKQLRSLLKKLRAIDDLKKRRDEGEKLEITQVNKISTEADVLKKLEGLGWTR